MTTVVAIAAGGSVYMAADTANNVYDRPIVNGARKISRVKVGAIGEALIGVSGAGAMAQLIRTKLHIDGEPIAGDEDPQPWADTIASAATEIAIAHGLVNDDHVIDCTLILGWRGRVWTLTHHQAIPHDDGIAAIGSGEGIAIGAADALLRVGVQPHQVVWHAVDIACKRDRYSAPPIQVETLEASPEG